MKAFSVLILISGAVSILAGSQTLDQARQLEHSGDSMRACALLARAAQPSPDDVTALTEYGEFLDRYGDPGCRDAYRKLVELLGNAGNTARRAEIAKRLLVLDLLAGDKAAVTRDLELS